MSSTPGNRRQWEELLQGSIKLPERWYFLPHEIVLMLFAGVACLRVGFAAGFDQTNSLLFLVYLLFLVWVIGWCQLRPSPSRWRCRMLLTLTISGLCYFSLKDAVPMMQNPNDLKSLNWHQDATLEQWDILLLGDFPSKLMTLSLPNWASDLLMVCYFFFFYYIVGGLLYYLLTDLRKFRCAVVGFGTLYALGYVGYMLMPAVGPYVELEPRTGGWITDVGGAFIVKRSNGVDVFPSIHMAASLYLLMFDFQNRRIHFWWVLAPTVGLWISTIYLRYHYGVDLVAGIILALGCWWLTRWFAASQLCVEVEAECEAYERKPEKIHSES